LGTTSIQEMCYWQHGLGYLLSTTLPSCLFGQQVIL
jgi:hypothetical protein